MIEKGDYFEDDKQNKYQVIHKNKNEITVAIRTNRDVMIQIRDQNFFDKLTKKVGYVKYCNWKDKFEKRKEHWVYELLFKTPKRYISLMVSEMPAYELLIGSYYRTTWGYNLKQKEIIQLNNVLRIYTDLREKQVEELKFNRDAYVLEERAEFIDRIS